MATDITTDRLRELAETRTAAGKVLSVFINLDPREFAAPPARATEISSVLDEASRTIRDLDGLTHEERSALQADVERVARRAGQRRRPGGRPRPRGVRLAARRSCSRSSSCRARSSTRSRSATRRASSRWRGSATGELWWLVLVDRRHARLLAGTDRRAGRAVARRRADQRRAPAGRLSQSRGDQAAARRAATSAAIEKEVDNHLRGVGERAAPAAARRSASRASSSAGRVEAVVALRGRCCTPTSRSA